MEPDLINTLSYKLGFTWEFKQESGWVRYGKRGEIVGGTYGSVARNQSDLGIGHLGPDTMVVIPNASK